MNVALVEESFNKLKDYCEKQEFKGYDPYDGLNSKFFSKLFLLKNIKYVKLAWIQFFKRSPINLRTLFGVEKDYNSKGLGLFLAGYCNLYRLNPNPEYLGKIRELSQKLIQLRSVGYSGSCWGYNFDWQALAFFQPKGTPTVVATTFISYALLDAYELTKDEELLKIAIDSKEFILKDLNRTYDNDGNFAFSYSPLDNTQVFNASLLGSRLLSRIYCYTQDEKLLEEARKSIVYCCNNQKEDGSWSYGTLPFHKWIDNFHTGYNLECIQEYQSYSGDTSFDQNIQHGLKYYLETFFTENGIPKYYNNKVFPIDIHNTSQLIITLSKLNKFEANKKLIDLVLNWSIKNMQDEKGYFYYQMNKWFNSKIPYMRWAQSWMFYGMSEYLMNVKGKMKH